MEGIQNTSQGRLSSPMKQRRKTNEERIAITDNETTSGDTRKNTMLITDNGSNSEVNKNTRYSTPVILHQKTTKYWKTFNAKKATREHIRRYKANQCPWNDFRRQLKTDTLAIAANADNPEDTRRRKTMSSIEMTPIDSKPFIGN